MNSLFTNYVFREIKKNKENNFFNIIYLFKVLIVY